MRNSRMKSSMFSLLGAMLLADGMNMREYYEDKVGYGDNNITPNDFSGKPKLVIPKGCKEYTFEDGFKCIASSQKQADKKHIKYLNK